MRDLQDTLERPDERRGVAESQSEQPEQQNGQLIDCSFKTIINAPFDKVDIPAWCFGLPDHEYQGCSPAHVAAGATTTPDGTRMSINVEVIGGAILVQHYVEKFARKDHLLLESNTDIFTPTGRSTLEVTWEMSVSDLGGGRCEFTNHVKSAASEGLLTSLAKQGIAFEQFRLQRRPSSLEHVERETPLFAASIERAALRS